MARETKAQMEARIKAEVLAEVTPAKEAKPKGRKVAIPAFAATAPHEVIGLTSTGSRWLVCVAERDGESNAPKGSDKSADGLRKSRKFTPDTLAYILDHADEMRKLIDTASKLNQPTA